MHQQFKLADWLAQARPDLSFPQQAGDEADIRVAHCPERVLSGSVLQELVANKRVNILKPGPGVGGHCIAVDPWFIVDSAPDEARLIRSAREINDSKPKFILDKIKTAADEFKRPVIACLGLAFKADIDDLRESPALDITQQILAQGIGEVLVVEPNIKTLPKALAEKGATLVKLDDALEKANTIVALVDHKEFNKISANTLNSKVVIDTRGIW